MHTICTKVGDHDATINYNSDWSGNVTLNWTDESGARRELEVPGAFFLAAAGPIVGAAFEDAADHIVGVMGTFAEMGHL